MSVIEQTALLIGEPKLGLWRIQDNGLIREYRMTGNQGLRESVDANDIDGLSPEHLRVIKSDYRHFIPEEGRDGYKSPSDRIWHSHQNYLDLSIYHPKYKGKYDDHVPIDLPHLFCTMSQENFPHMWKVWKFAVAQKQSNENVIGDLGKRAGRSQDIKCFDRLIPFIQGLSFVMHDYKSKYLSFQRS